MTNCAPIALFVYKRLDLTKQAVQTLQQNHLAARSHLYVFSDAAKSAADEELVSQVRTYTSCIDGFAAVTVIVANENQGCANSVIAGVSKVFERHDRIIVVEDDLIVTPNFLDYMNAALGYYSSKNIFSISGWGIGLRFDPSDITDVYYLPRESSWGWATWKNRWEGIDWKVSDYSEFKNDKAARHKFDLGGRDLSRMLDLQMNGRLDSWAIRWCYAQSKTGMLTVYPKLSKVDNMGFGQDATHTSNHPNLKVRLDDTDRTTFNFSSPIEIAPDLLRQFTYYFSIPYKVKNRLRNYLMAICRSVS